MIFIKKASSRRRKGHLGKEINMTPLIDVLLVLLIIFMVTTPMMQIGVPVDLPEGHGSSEQKASVEKSLILSLTPLGELFVGEEKVDRKNIVTYLDAKGGKNKALVLKADRTLPYEKILELMSFLALHGYGKLMLLCETAS